LEGAQSFQGREEKRSKRIENGFQIENRLRRKGKKKKKGLYAVCPATGKRFPGTR